MAQTTKPLARLAYLNPGLGGILQLRGIHDALQHMHIGSNPKPRENGARWLGQRSGALPPPVGSCGNTNNPWSPPVCILTQQAQILRPQTSSGSTGRIAHFTSEMCQALRVGRCGISLRACRLHCMTARPFAEDVVLLQSPVADLVACTGCSALRINTHIMRTVPPEFTLTPDFPSRCHAEGLC